MSSKNTFCAGILLCLAAAAFNATAASNADPVVSRGGVTVTFQDVDAFMARVPADKWAGFINSPERIESVLRDILRNKELAAQAHEMRLDDSDAARAQIEQAKTDVLARLRMQAFEKSIQTPDFEQLAKEEYRGHKDQYSVAANVTVQQILISTKDRSADEALKLAQLVREKALQKPDSFDALVDEYSDDKSKRSNAGRIRDATSDKYVPEFAKAAGKLTSEHPISEPVKTTYGYHVLKLLSSTPARQKTFDEVKASIVERLRSQYIDDQKKQFLSNLAAQPMTPYPDAIASLHSRYSTGDGEPVTQPAPAADEATGTKPAN